MAASDVYKRKTHRFLAGFKLVIVDFDRTFPIAPLILAAKARNIKTITLVHGSLSSYGYTPILADEIWCWGRFQKEQLLDLNVCNSAIKIVGNPAIFKINKSYDFKNDNATKYFKNQNLFTLGIVLTRKNSEYLKFILEVRDKLNDSPINFLIKKHPFIDIKEELSIEKEIALNLKIFNNDLNDNYCFYHNCDLLITSGSSMTFEAIINDTPVCLIKLLPHEHTESKNLFQMRRDLNIPLFEDSYSTSTYIKNLLRHRELKGETLELQQIAVKNSIYSFIGDESIQNIKSQIKLNL